MKWKSLDTTHIWAGLLNNIGLWLQMKTIISHLWGSIATKIETLFCQYHLQAQFPNSKLPASFFHTPLRCPAFSTHKYGRRKMMRFTDKKGIKIYCCVSFSPCKVWIKCHTLACELLNELVCSLWCGACKYSSWVWNGDCLVGGGGPRGLWIAGHIWVFHQQLGRSKGPSTKKLYWLVVSGR